MKKLHYYFFFIAAILIAFGLISQCKNSGHAPKEEPKLEKNVFFAAPWDKKFNYVKYDKNFGLIFHLRDGREYVIMPDLRHQVIVKHNYALSVTFIQRGKQHDEAESILFILSPRSNESAIRDILEKEGHFVTSKSFMDNIWDYYIY